MDSNFFADCNSTCGDRSFYRTVVISDLHLGSSHSKVKELGDFLSTVDCGRLILNGDIIDGWQLQKSGVKHWNREYSRFFRIIMKMMENHSTEVVYVRGNHDDFMEQMVPFSFLNIRIVRDYLIDSGGKRYFVTHGDLFDNVTTNMKWLAKLGDWGYTMLLWINGLYNRYRKSRGLGYFSLSQAVKHKVKQAVSYISDFENVLADFAVSRKCDGVICGHIHHPENRMINGIHYLNSGDWVESLSALVESSDGKWDVYRFYDHRLLSMPVLNSPSFNEAA